MDERMTMADLTEGQQRNARLIALLEQIAKDHQITRYGEPSLSALSHRVSGGESYSLYQGTQKGSRPEVDTLVRTARWAGINPLVLFEAAGWITEDDVRGAAAELPRPYGRNDYEVAATMREMMSPEARRMLAELRDAAVQFAALVPPEGSVPDAQTTGAPDECAPPGPRTPTPGASGVSGSSG